MDDIAILNMRLVQLDEEIEQIEQALRQFDGLDECNAALTQIEEAYYASKTSLDIVREACELLGADGVIFYSKQVVTHCAKVRHVHALIHKLKEQGIVEHVARGKWRWIELE